MKNENYYLLIQIHKIPFNQVVSEEQAAEIWGLGSTATSNMFLKDSVLGWFKPAGKGKGKEKWKRIKSDPIYETAASYKPGDEIEIKDEKYVVTFADGLFWTCMDRKGKYRLVSIKDIINALRGIQ